MTKDKIIIRECDTIKDLTACTRLQREVFALPDIEISPVRHLVVTKHAGGFTLGAFAEGKLVGFVLSVPAFFGSEKFFYSHMTAVSSEFQSHGIGAKLKWAQREKALTENIKLIKWTFQPIQARNAFFNLEKLGAIVRRYKSNFYGTDYSTSNKQGEKIGLDSDRLFAEWNLEDEKVIKLASGKNYVETGEIAWTIEIPSDWNYLLKTDAEFAKSEQTRVKNEFEKAFAENLICKSFVRDEQKPKYLLFKD
ncbi:MAG: GNAT family N-acetyltransferase [Acidobacteriota bacterium]